MKIKLPAALGLSALFALPAFAQPVTQPFTFNLRSQNMPAVRNAALAWADIDNDGDLDALVSGRGAAGLTGGIYRNDGSGENGVSFAALPSTIRGLVYGKAAFADIDGDGDLDVALSGSERIQAPYSPIVVVYRNDGGTFSEIDHGGAIPSLHSGALAWGDYENDGDLDLLISGVDDAGAFVTSVAISDGAGGFSTADPGLPGFAFGDAKWGDYDADGDADILISGATDEGFQTRIYSNMGGGDFQDAGASFEPVAFSSVDWGDYDADGDLDVVVAGGQVTPRIFEGQTRLYSNQNGSFSPVDAGVAGTLAGSVTFGDYDNDGDLDLLTLGAETALGRRTARVYKNNGAGDFSSASLLVGAIFAAADWGDFDGDGDLDLLASGATSFGENILNLYENERQVRPDRPAAPSATRVHYDGDAVVLEWTDTQPGVVTYDVRIGTYPGGADVRAVPADPASGLRRIARPGFYTSASTYVRDLPAGTYYWSVQAVGPSFEASVFSPEGTFDVSDTATGIDEESLFPTEFALHPAYPNPSAGDTRVGYDLPEAAKVTIAVYDLLGRQATILVDGVVQAGKHTAVWDAASSLAGGVYFLEMRAGTYRTTRPVTLVR